MTRETILQAMNWRYAGKIFNPNLKLTDEQLETILEAGRLSPSVFGVESWQFIVVNNPELRKKMKEVSYGQPKVTDASHIIVIASRTDGQKVMDELVERTAKTQGKTIADLKGFSDMVHGALSGKSDDAIKGWYKAQTYIPLGIMIETAALLGIDSGPMEGFDAERIDEILGLKEKNLHASTMLALGFRGEDEYSKLPKTRKSFEEIVTIVD